MNSIGAAPATRLVETTVPAGTMTVSSWGPVSRKSTPTVAADGGNSVSPIMSRNLIWTRSGTRLSRYSNRSVIQANASTNVTPGSETLWSVHSGHRSWM